MLKHLTIITNCPLDPVYHKTHVEVWHSQNNLKSFYIGIQGYCFLQKSDWIRERNDPTGPLYTNGAKTLNDKVLFGLVELQGESLVNSCFPRPHF